MMPEKRAFSDCCPHICGWYLSFSPFENQYAVRLQYAHTLLKSVMQHFAPVLAELSVLLPHPRIFSNAAQVRRVKYDQRKRIIRERQICEVAQHVRMHDACSFRTSVCAFPNTRIFLVPRIAVDCGRMVLVEPNRSAPAGHVKNFLCHVIPPLTE